MFYCLLTGLVIKNTLLNTIKQKYRIYILHSMKEYGLNTTPGVLRNYTFTVHIVLTLPLKSVSTYCSRFTDHSLCESSPTVKLVPTVTEYPRLRLTSKRNGEPVSVLCLYFLEITINPNYTFFFKFWFFQDNTDKIKTL